MSFDTQRRKLRTSWEGAEDNRNQVDTATLLQGKKKVIIKLSESNDTVFGKMRSMNSEWTPMVIVGVNELGTYIDKSVSFQVELSLPQNIIPYARLNIAYRKTGSTDPFAGTSIIYNCFSQVIDTNRENIKKVIWNVSFTQEKYGTLPPWYEYEVKLLFTIINPHQMCIS